MDSIKSATPKRSIRSDFCRTICLCMVVLLCVLTCSCSNNGSGTNSPTPTIGVDVSNAEYGGDIRLPMPENAVIDDPMIVNTEEMLQVYSLIFEGLLDVDSEGKLIPSLAQSWTADAQNGAVWTLNLRDNAKWHTGETFSSADVVYSFKRLKNHVDGNTQLSNTYGVGMTEYTCLSARKEPTDTESPTETPMMPEPTPTEQPSETVEPTATLAVETPILTEEPTVTPESSITPGASPTPTRAPAPTVPPDSTPVEADSSYYKYHVSKIASVEAVDTFTVKVTMNEPGVSSLYALTFPIMCERSAGSTLLVGTGAYVAKSATKDKITLTANESWWKQKPYITNITFEARINNETALASYEAGQLDMVSTSMLSVGRYKEDGKTEVLDFMTQGIDLMLYNFSNLHLKNTQVRQAISYAIDTNRIISNAYMNKARACDVPFAPDSWLYDSKCKVFEFNIDTAKKLLYEAGYSDTDGDGILELTTAPSQKLSFTLLVNENPDNTARRNCAEMIREELLECGIEIIVESEYYSVSSSAKSTYITRLQERDFDLALTGFNMSMDGDIRNLFSLDENSSNYGRYDDAELRMLAENIVFSVDEAEMRDAAYALQAAFITKIPFTVLFCRTNSLVYSAEIKGVSGLREPNIMRTIDSWYINTKN